MAKNKKQYAKNGYTSSIRTTDPDDPRLRAYNDSLLLYNLSEKQRLKGTNNKENYLFNKQGSDLMSKEERKWWQEARKQLEGKFFPNSEVSIQIQGSDDRKNPNSMQNDYNNDEYFHPDIKPIKGYNWSTAEGFKRLSESNDNFLYKKPEQQIILESKKDNISSSLFPSSSTYDKIETFKPKKEGITRLNTTSSNIQRPIRSEVDLSKRQVQQNPQNFSLSFPEKRTMQNVGNPTKTLKYNTEEDMRNAMEYIKSKTGVSPNRTTFRRDGTEGSGGYTSYFDEISKGINKDDYRMGGQVKYYADGGWPYDNQQLGEELILPQQSNNYSNWGGQNSFNLPEANFPAYTGKLEQGSSPFSFESYKNKKPLYDNSFGVKGESSKRANSLQNMKGLEQSGDISEGSVAQAKTDIAGSVFNAVGTGLESFAPPDSKFGKAMQKGNSFAKTAEPLKMLDMAVPGLGTGLVEGARLVGAITGGVQAKNEEIDTKRIEDNTNFLKKYQNFNFDKVSQGNRMAEEGYNVQGNDDQLIQEIFQDFDNLLGIQEPQMRYGGKLYANDGFNVPNNYASLPDPRVVPSYTPSGVLGIQGKSPEQAQEIASYMDFNQDELYQFKDNDSMKDLIPINTPGYTASRLNPIYRKMPNSKQYIPLSKQQYNKGLSFIE
jgi:hypothetical protein